MQKIIFERYSREIKNNINASDKLKVHTLKR